MADLLLPPSPFLSTNEVATVVPAWVREIAGADDPTAAARAWFDAHAGPVTGRPHEIDDVPMVEVSLTTWVEGGIHTPFALVAGLQQGWAGDLSPFAMRPVAGTPLHQVTYLLPADGTYSYHLASVDPAELAAADQPLHALYGAAGPDERNPRRLLGRSVWVGPRFSGHPMVTATAPEQADDLDELTVTHADGRERQVWVHRAASGTTRTVVFLDGDAWRDAGVGAALWQAAGYDANLVLMSSMEMADRTPDLTEHERAASTLGDVLAAVGSRWGLSFGPDDVVLVGQSFGGLAVAGVVLHHPELASSGVCISGSFFYRVGEPLPQDLDQVGTQREALTSLDAPAGRIVMLSGRDEPIAGQSLAFLGEARAAGVDIVSFTHLRGTHDYAWWQHANLLGLDELMGVERA